MNAQRRIPLTKERKFPPVKIWKPDSNGRTFQNPYDRSTRPLMGQAVVKQRREIEALEVIHKRFSLKDWLKRRLKCVR